MFEHQDILEKLNHNRPLSDKLRVIHETLQSYFPFVHRVAIAIYDKDTDTLSAYTHYSEGINPLSHYQAKLNETYGLKQILEVGRPRLITDLEDISTPSKEHTHRLIGGGFRSSYTMPLYHNGDFLGFLFFNSREASAFKETHLQMLDIFGHLIALTMINEIATIKTLTSTIDAVRKMAGYRDLETGSHINRTAHYARLIANYVADEYRLNDEFIEHVFLFSPLHDIGKIAIPDKVLLKRGALDSEERTIMNTHAQKGREIIDEILSSFEFSEHQFADILRNIAQYHHETMDGMGYPYGLRGDEIPVEARIMAVADIFDALTSERPYKKAWSIDSAFVKLLEMSEHKLDRECVTALIKNRQQVEEIMSRFVEEKYP
jgi:HD-GYP domain-containing protein (c-di-GMP phosphodiesterase class II)